MKIKNVIISLGFVVVNLIVDVALPTSKLFDSTITTVMSAALKTILILVLCKTVD